MTKDERNLIFCMEILKANFLTRRIIMLQVHIYKSLYVYTHEVYVKTCQVFICVSSLCLFFMIVVELIQNSFMHMHFFLLVYDLYIIYTCIVCTHKIIDYK